MTGMGVRRDKAAVSSGCKPDPAIRSNTAPDKAGLLHPLLPAHDAAGGFAAE
jgi:hypothetical protein